MRKIIRMNYSEEGQIIIKQVHTAKITGSNVKWTQTFERGIS